MSNTGNLKSSMLKVVGTGVVASALIMFYMRRRKTLNNGSSRSFTVMDDESCGSLDTDSPLPSTWTSLGLEQPLVIAMCGLPARGAVPHSQPYGDVSLPFNLLNLLLHLNDLTREILCCQNDYEIPALDWFRM